LHPFELPLGYGFQGLFRLLIRNIQPLEKCLETVFNCIPDRFFKGRAAEGFTLKIKFFFFQGLFLGYLLIQFLIGGIELVFRSFEFGFKRGYAGSVLRIVGGNRRCHGCVR
jgi:hypothetical protein